MAPRAWAEWTCSHCVAASAPYGAEAVEQTSSKLEAAWQRAAFFFRAKGLSLENHAAILRPFKESDVRIILRIERTCFADDAWTQEAFLDYFRAGRSLFLVAEIQGRAAGYIIARFAPHGAEIDSLAVLPRHRRKGIATQLMKAAMRRLRRGGAGTVWLTVQSKNQRAIWLYRKLGFVRSRTLPGYYADNLSGWRMRSHGPD